MLSIFMFLIVFKLKKIMITDTLLYNIKKTKNLSTPLFIVKK